MSKTIRVLIVEDSENDTLLLVRELRRSGFELEFERVDTAQAMAAALANQKWDLVISDYTMPHFSGIAALELLKESNIDIPFIIMSGSIGEDVAVAAMKAGAHDYLMKGNVQRLGPSIERELREAEVRHQRKRAEMKVKLNMERLQALHEIGFATASTLDLRAVLNILLEKINLFFPNFAVTVTLVNKETGELEPVACRNVSEKAWRESRRKGLRGLSKIVVERKIALTVANVQTDPRSSVSDFVQTEGLVSYVGVPLIANDQVLGLIAFYTRERHPFADDEIEFLTTLAGQAAVAIHNSQLFEQAKISGEKLDVTNQHLEKSLKELSRLYIALAPLSPAESVNEMLDGIVERLMAATGADSALIRLEDREKRGFFLVGQRGFPDYYLKSIETILPGGAVDWILKRGEAMIASDIAADPRLKGKVQLQAGLRSCAMLPLKVQNEVRGIVHLASRELGYFDESHKDSLTAIARLMGVALENKYLFDELRASRDTLEKSNKVKDEFLSVMSHELRTPLNVIMGYTRLVREGTFGEIEAEQDGALEKVATQSKYLLEMVEGIIRVTRIETGKADIDRGVFDLAKFFNELKSSYDFRLDNAIKFKWNYPQEVTKVCSDGDKLRHILQNLINNAIKFTDKGTVTVSVGVLQGANALECQVADTGIGIPNAYLPSIFEMFRQVDSSETRTYGGLGLGLYIVRKYAELLSGTVEVRSEPGRGSVFTVRIPLEIVKSDWAMESPDEIVI